MADERLHELKVLVLDDSHNFIAIMRSILKGFGIKKIFDARNAVTALEILQVHRVDIAFVDLRMKDLDGFEFVKLIRNAEDSPNATLPIVMVSADGKLATVKQALHNGIDDFLTKPVRPVDIYNRLVSVMNNPRSYISTSSGYFGPDRRRRMDAGYCGPERRKRDESAVATQPRDVFQVD